MLFNRPAEALAQCVARGAKHESRTRTSASAQTTFCRLQLTENLSTISIQNPIRNPIYFFTFAYVNI